MVSGGLDSVDASGSATPVRLTRQAKKVGTIDIQDQLDDL